MGTDTRNYMEAFMKEVRIYVYKIIVERPDFPINLLDEKVVKDVM